VSSIYNEWTPELELAATFVGPLLVIRSRPSKSAHLAASRCFTRPIDTLSEPAAIPGRSVGARRASQAVYTPDSLRKTAASHSLRVSQGRRYSK
jgi:hypothetical protein